MRGTRDNSESHDESIVILLPLSRYPWIIGGQLAALGRRLELLKEFGKDSEAMMPPAGDVQVIVHQKMVVFVAQDSKSIEQ